MRARSSSRTSPWRRASIWSCLAVAVFVGVTGLVEHVGYLFPILVILGIAVGVLNVTVTTLMTMRTPEARRGRMFAATGAVFTSAQILGTVFGGLILTSSPRAPSSRWPG